MFPILCQNALNFLMKVFQVLINIKTCPDLVPPPIYLVPRLKILYISFFHKQSSHTQALCLFFNICHGKKFLFNNRQTVTKKVRYAWHSYSYTRLKRSAGHIKISCSASGDLSNKLSWVGIREDDSLKYHISQFIETLEKMYNQIVFIEKNNSHRP